MTTSDRCLQCGLPLTEAAPAGLCPKCLVRAAMASEPPASRTEPSPTQSRFVAPAVEDLAACFPQLEILELVGQGGMGAVYKARQPGLDRIVAVKVLPPEVGRDPSFAERFSREARALARLSHPHIVAIHDFGRVPANEKAGRRSEFYYFVMEFVDGANLRHLIDQRRLQPAEALAIVPQLCDALQYAHEEGVVHRDIKPENILVDRRGRVKIADFGLSKLLVGDDGERHDLSLTGTHQVMGTPRYMAPEQMEGSKSVDHRADIYSLGVVFYEMLTGELPLGRFAPPSQKVRVDVRLDEVVLRSLEKEPERRYQHASEVKTDVEAISRASTLQPQRSTSASPDRAAAPSVVLQSPRVRWAYVGVALCFLLPAFALFALAMWISNSAWVLAALVVPWFFLGLAGAYYDGTATERTCNAVATVAFLISAVLIAAGIWLERSAYALLAIAPAMGGLIAGIWLGVASKSDDAPSKESAGGDTTGVAAADAEKDEEGGENPSESLQQVAWFVGAVGAARSWSFFPKLPGVLDKLFSGRAIDAPELLIELTGPVILLAAIAMYHARYYWYAVAASLLCFVTGHIVAIIAGVWSLVVLFDPAVRALFAANAASSSAVPGVGPLPAAPAKPILPLGDGAPLGSRFSDAWSAWWQQRDELFARTVQAVLLLVYIAALIAFLSFNSSSVTEAGQSQFQSQIGWPSPWFTVQLSQGQKSSFDQWIHWYSSAWLVAGIGFAAWYVNWWIERAQNPFPNAWNKPSTAIVIWSVLAVLCVGLNVGLCLWEAHGDRGLQSAVADSRSVSEPSNVASISATTPEAVSEAATTETTATPGPVASGAEAVPATAASTAEALLAAVAAGDIARVRELLREGASINCKDANGQTPLMKAIANGHRSLALTLVLLGADLAEQDREGKTAMMLAVEQGDHVFLKRLRDLAQISWKVNETERQSELRALSGVERTLLQENEVDLRNLDLLVIERLTDQSGETASLKAARLGDWEILGLVATQTETLQARDPAGRSIAMLAALHGHTAWFEPLLEKPYFGIGGGSYERDFSFVGEMLAFRLEHLALQDRDGKTALQLAAEQGHQRIASILRAHLEAILANLDARREKGELDPVDYIRLRALAWMALGKSDTQRAESRTDAAPQ